MARKIVYLLNPIAGRGGRSSIKELIRQRTTEAGIPFEILMTNREGDYAFLERKISAENITDVVIAGGDGTISQLAACLRHTGVQFGLIPCGSGNGLAFAAGISKDPTKALDIIFNGEAGYIDSFRINNQFSCMLSGVGFDAKVAHEFARTPGRGLWTYVKVAAKNFFRTKPYPFVLTINDETIEAQAFFISIANSNQFGNQFTIAPKADLQDGKIDIVVVKEMSKFQLVLSVLHQLRFGDIQEDIFSRKGILYFQTHKLQIQNPSMAPLHIDGDPADTTHLLEIEIIPSAFRLIRPSAT